VIDRFFDRHYRSLVMPAPFRRHEKKTEPLRLRMFRSLLRRLEGLARRLDRVPGKPESHSIGQYGEDLAYWFLRQQGYTIVARNYRRPPLRGEIDLIAWEGDTLVFVEVKTRAASGEYTPEQAVHRDKRLQLVRVARYYRRRRGVRSRFRYDIVAIRHSGGSQAEMELHRDAFREDQG
jgi:putative endonuclease